MRIIAVTLSILLFACKISACPFCDSTVIQNQCIYQNEETLILLSYQPMEKGHSLIIPKRHVERYEDLTEEEILSINQMIKKLASAMEETMGKSSYLLLQKNGKEVGQTVPHLHFHFIPREANGQSPISLLFNFFITIFKPKLSLPEMQETIAQIQKGFTESIVEESKPIVNEHWQQMGI